ncbi:MAG: hypothetical protein PHE49_11010 [bacterium]|nr:hypothetical protein [bacterium]
MPKQRKKYKRNTGGTVYEINNVTIQEIDIGIRRYIKKLNSGGGIRTTLSCAGHYEENHCIKSPYLTMKFDTEEIREIFVKNLFLQKPEFKLNYCRNLSNDLGINIVKDGYKTTNNLLKEIRKDLFESILRSAEATKNMKEVKVPINYIPVKTDDHNGYFDIHLDKKSHCINWEVYTIG